MNIFLGRRREVTNVAIIDSTYFECEYIDTSLATNTGINTNMPSYSTVYGTHWVLDIKPNNNKNTSKNRFLIFRATSGNSWLQFTDNNTYRTYKKDSTEGAGHTLLNENSNTPLRRIVKATFFTNKWMYSAVDTESLYNTFATGNASTVQLLGGTSGAPFLGIIYKATGYRFTGHSGGEVYEENSADIVIDLIPAYNIHTTVYGLYDKKSKIFYPIEGATGEIKYI